MITAFSAFSAYRPSFGVMLWLRVVPEVFFSKAPSDVNC
jgi:hypothetical protein